MIRRLSIRRSPLPQWSARARGFYTGSLMQFGMPLEEIVARFLGVVHGT
jgi:hypothetical protein